VILLSGKVKTFRLVIDFDFHHYRPVDPEDNFVFGNDGLYHLTATHIPRAKEIVTLLRSLLADHRDLDKFELEIIGSTSCMAWRKSVPLYSFVYNRPPPFERVTAKSLKQQVDANAIDDLYHWIDEAREEDFREAREPFIIVPAGEEAADIAQH
jgi:hypothetical protein